LGTCYRAGALSLSTWLKLALGVAALVTGPLCLAAWNAISGSAGFSAPPGGPRWFSTRPGFFECEGCRDPELSPTGTVFNWSGPKAAFRFPRLGRSKPTLVNVRIQGIVAATSKAPDVVFSVDGAETMRMSVPTSPKRVTLLLPSRAGRGAVVSLNVEGSEGVMVENVRLGLDGPGPLPVPYEAWATLAFVSLAAYLAASVAGATPWIAWGVACVHALALSWLAVVGGAFLGRYSERLAWITLVGLVLCLVARWIESMTWRRAAVAVILITAIKLAALGHPQIIDGDAAFHAGNLGRVLRGDWFFTSATPPPAISFPYPPGLSTAALPFARSIRQGDWVTLLRVLVLIAELIAAVAFSRAVAALSSEYVGAMTFLLLALSPEGWLILFIGNLANLFSDAVMFLGCTYLLTGSPIAASVWLLYAYLSHFGTLLLGAPLSFLLAVSQGEMLTRIGRRVAPVLLALFASFLIYYRHFMSIVVDAWDRLTYVQGAVATGPMAAPAADKLARMTGGNDWWVPVLVLCTVALGMATWPRDRKPLARIVFVWMLVVFGFALLGLVTPVQVRSALAGRPAVAVLCASGICVLWSRGRVAKAIAGLLVALTAIGCWKIAIGFFPVRPS
jgi:hypothetical protein